MDNIVLFIRRNKAPVIMFLILGATLFFVFGRGQGTNNPAKNKTDKNPRAGKDYALLYNQGKLYAAIKSNDDNLQYIQQDLMRFARVTRPEFSSKDSLVGFTLDGGEQKSDNAYSYTGHYYSLKDDIKLVVNVFDKGIIRLSITNQEDKTNIDEYLSLNGPKNRLLEALPIENDAYTIRYLNASDKVIVTFYEGYTKTDVDTAVVALKKAYGDAYREDEFTFSINSIGIFTVQEVINNLTNPIPRR